jgi:hypothetical protein
MDLPVPHDTNLSFEEVTRLRELVVDHLWPDLVKSAQHVKEFHPAMVEGEPTTLGLASIGWAIQTYPIPREFFPPFLPQAERRLASPRQHQGPERRQPRALSTPYHAAMANA